MEWTDSPVISPWRPLGQTQRRGAGRQATRCACGPAGCGPAIPRAPPAGGLRGGPLPAAPTNETHQNPSGKTLKPRAPRRQASRSREPSPLSPSRSPRPRPTRSHCLRGRTGPPGARRTLSESASHGGRARVGGVGRQSLLPCHGRPARYVCCGFRPVVNL